MKVFNNLLSTGLATVIASLAYAQSTATDGAAPPEPTTANNAWAFHGVTIFAANEGFGASYIRFDVQNSEAGGPPGSEYSTSCSAVAFPSDPINGGTTPTSYLTGGVQGGCDNPNATFNWDGSTLETIYSYGSGEIEKAMKYFHGTMTSENWLGIRSRDSRKIRVWLDFAVKQGIMTLDCAQSNEVKAAMGILANPFGLQEIQFLSVHATRLAEMSMCLSSAP
ncbi:MAG: hypothetical protein Q9162_007215 [Coniocarpon cinnabarinum]